MSSTSSFEKGLQLLDSGNYDAAKECFEENLKSADSQSSKDYADNLLFLGNVQIKIDDNQAARTNLVKAEKVYSKQDAKEELANAMTKHGEALSNLDETGPALEKLDEALELARTACGPYSTQVSDTLAIQGINHLKRNELDDADRKLAKSFGMRKGLYGAKHSEVALSMNYLSQCYSQAENYTPAEVLAKQALAMQENLIGKAHPDYGVTLYNLATVYVKQGRMMKAEPFARDAVDLLKERLPETHSLNVWTIDRLGSVMLSTNDSIRAKELYTEGLAKAQKKWGKDSPNTVSSLIGLGLAHLNCGDFQSSERYLSIALDLMQNSSEVDASIEYSLLQQLACSYIFQLKLGDAVRLVPDSLRARHTSNFSETMDLVHKIINFVSSQVERIKN